MRCFSLVFVASARSAVRNPVEQQHKESRSTGKRQHSLFVGSSSNEFVLLFEHCKSSDGGFSGVVWFVCVQDAQCCLPVHACAVMLYCASSARCRNVRYTVWYLCHSIDDGGSTLLSINSNLPGVYLQCGALIDRVVLY